MTGVSSMYIRTKDSVYKVSEYNDYATHKRKGSTLVEKDRTSYIRNKNIIKQSETIEDLGDEFVCEWFDKEVNRYRHVYCRFKIGQSKELYRRDIPLPANVDFEIYVGIWVNGKGLTYVAKMNDDGKLELI